MQKLQNVIQVSVKALKGGSQCQKPCVATTSHSQDIRRKLCGHLRNWGGPSWARLPG